MASRYYSQFKEKKIAAKGTRPSNPSGTAKAAKDKPAFPSAHAPGKTQPRDRSMGVPKCKVYPKSEGL